MKIWTLLILFSISIFAKNLEWININKLNSIESEKIALIEVMSEHCHYCKSMDKKVFSDSEVIDFLSKNFVTIRGDKYRDSMSSDFNTRMVPTFFFYDLKNRKVIKKVVGSWSKDDFLDFAKTVLKDKK